MRYAIGFLAGLLIGVFGLLCAFGGFVAGLMAGENSTPSYRRYTGRPPPAPRTTTEEGTTTP